MKWEYKLINAQIKDVPLAAFEDRLNTLGREGWELGTALQHEHHGYSHEVHLLFKRPVRETKG